MPFVSKNKVVEYSFKIELNIRYIIKLLEDILEKIVIPEEYFNSNQFYPYCHDLEMAYNPEKYGFKDWFKLNYDKVESWNDIQDLFIDIKEEKLEFVGFRPQPRIDECAGCKSICEECELLMIFEKKKK